MIENSIRKKALASQALMALIGDNFHLTENHNSKDNYIFLTVIDDETQVNLGEVMTFDLVIP